LHNFRLSEILPDRICGGSPAAAPLVGGSVWRDPFIQFAAAVLAMYPRCPSSAATRLYKYATELESEKDDMLVDT
jgi:hypothetical protein